MKYSDETNLQGLIQDITFWTGADTSEYPLAERNRNINQWYLQTAAWIFEADGRWQWDDANQTNRPCATTNLVSGQKGYQVLTASPSSGKDWLQVDRVELTDENDNEYKLHPLDQNDTGSALDEFMETNGTPKHYDFRGNSIFLYPASDYDKDAGLSIYFKRSPLQFESTDTTKQPGFASPYHRILSLGASYDFALSKGLKNTNSIRQELEILKKGLKDFYRNRDKYEKLQLKRVHKSYK